MGELSIHRWKGFELYPVINKKTVSGRSYACGDSSGKALGLKPTASHELWKQEENNSAGPVLYGCATQDVLTLPPPKGGGFLRSP